MPKCLLGLALMWMLAAAVPATAQPEETPTPAGEPERSFPESWVEFSAEVQAPGVDTELIDDVPNRFLVLKDQWTSDLPQDVIEARDSLEYYGRLGPDGRREALTLQECIALALQYNTQLEIQRLGPTGAAANVRRARSIFDPQAYSTVALTYLNVPATNLITAGFGSGVTVVTPGVPTPVATPSDQRIRNQYNRNLTGNVGMRKTLLTGGNLAFDWTNRRTVANPSVATPLVPTYATTFGLSLNQPLLRDFGWRYSLLIVEVAINTEAAAYEQYKAAIADIVAEVERRYWILVLAIQSVEVQKQSMELANELLRENEGKFNVGTLPRTAVLEAQSRVAQREATLIQATNAREIARDNLRALINYRDPGADSLLIVDPEDRPTAIDYDIDMERSLHDALTSRPELAAARLQVEGRGLERKIAQNQLLPRLDFVGAVGVNGLSGRDGHAQGLGTGGTVPINRNLDGGYGDALDLATDGRFYNYTAGAVIEVPLDNAQAKADYSIANVNLEQARLNLRQLEETVTLEIKTSVNNLQSGLKSISATRIARELAEENLRNQQARYDVGLATTKDILDFQDQLTLARFREIESLTSFNTEVAQMRRVEGTLLPARNIMVEKLEPESAPWWARF